MFPILHIIRYGGGQLSFGPSDNLVREFEGEGIVGVVGSGGVCSVKPPTKWFPCSELFEFQISSLFGNRSYQQLQRKLTNGFHPEGEEQGLGQKLSSMESLFNGSACHPPECIINQCAFLVHLRIVLMHFDDEYDN